ncbi:phage DNA packaging protein [Escherichia coli]|nr:phage DNA packaging protein [Escherichia coli]GDO87322.1 phage DNA packaging protein [Escherichia coli]
MSMYTTAQLLAANEKKFKFDPLFLRLFFRESYPFTTEKVYLSQIPGLVNMALYVSPIVSGEVTDDAAGQDTSVSPENALTGHENEVVSAQPDTVTDTADLVTVVALVTLHTDALHATRDEAVAFVLPGTAFRVSAGVSAEMTERGLARMQ